jgi:hypothetical protein
MMNQPILRVAITVAMAGVLGLTAAQTPAPTSTQKTISSTIGMYVFPNDGQKPDQQSKDEGECYNWAVQNTGLDPFQLQKQAQQLKAQEQQAQASAQAAANSGAGARGAVRGAAAGAVIGEIADNDAGKGAAIGAGVGAVAGRSKKRNAEKQATATAQQSQQAQQATKEQADQFKKAFGGCLESKKYMVK